jgi:hypothetical protein
MLLDVVCDLRGILLGVAACRRDGAAGDREHQRDGRDER